MDAPARSHVAVVGGGIAGIAAAVRLAEQGTRVTLLERSNRLGGRAGSFHDTTLDEPIDNCQHVALGCCDAYIDLLRTLGSEADLEWTSSFHYIEPGGRVSTLPIPDWPSPLHGLPLLARARFLSVADRLAIARAMNSLLRSPKTGDHQSFADWLASKRQPASVIERFWAPIVVSACNARPDQCDAPAAIKVFRDGFLASAKAARMGVPRVPLARLYSRVPDLLEAAGGGVRLSAHVESIEPNRVTLRSGEPVEADAVILATPFAATADLLEASVIDVHAVVAGLRSLQHSPIVAVHAEFDEPVSSLPHAVMLEADFDWLFFKDAGRRVHAVASAADALTGRSSDELVASLVNLLKDRFGTDAPPTWARAIKERRATFLVEPGSDAHRPAIDALAPSVWLAGDYTQTGWPATMEGATRSGRSAADALTDYLSQNQTDSVLSVKAR